MLFFRRLFSLVGNVAHQLAWCSHCLFSKWAGNKYLKYLLLMALYLISLLLAFRFSGYPALAIILAMVVFNLGINIFYFQMRSEEQDVMDGLLFRKDDATTVIQSGVMGDISEQPIPADAPRTSYLTREHEKLYTPGIVLLSNLFQIICFGCICAEIYRFTGDRCFTSSTTPTLFSWLVFTMENVFRAADIVDCFEAYGVQFRDIQYHGIFAGTLVAVFRLLVDILLIQAIAQYLAFEKRKNKVIQALAIDSENAKLQAKRIGDSIIPKVMDALHSQNPKIREQAIELLGQMKAKSALPILSRFLEDKNEEIRLKVVKAARHIKDASVIPQLAKRLYDEDQQIQWQAAEALGEIGDKSALPYLHKKFENSDSFTQKQVADALKNFMDVGNIRFLHEKVTTVQGEAQGQVIHALWSIAFAFDHLERQEKKADVEQELKKSVESLLELLKDKKTFWREEVIDTLGYIRGERAKEVLLNLFSDDDEKIQNATLQSLRKFDDDSLLPYFERMLGSNDKTVKELATRAINFFKE